MHPNAPKELAAQHCYTVIYIKLIPFAKLCVNWQHVHSHYEVYWPSPSLAVTYSRALAVIKSHAK